MIVVWFNFLVSDAPNIQDPITTGWTKETIQLQLFCTCLPIEHARETMGYQGNWKHRFYTVMILQSPS